MSEEASEVLKSLLPIAVALIAVVGGGIVYNWQKSIDRKNQILQERRVLYRDFMGKVQRLLLDRQINDREDSIEHFFAFKLLVAELLVTAPDEVIKPLKNSDKAMKELLRITFTKQDGSPYSSGDISTAENEFFSAYDDTVLEMRKDSFGNTEITAAISKAMLESMRVSLGVFR